MSVITGNPRRRGTKSARAYLQRRQASREGGSRATPGHSVQRSPTPAVVAAAKPQRVAPPFPGPGENAGASKAGGKKQKGKKKLTKEEKRKRYLKWAFWLALTLAVYLVFVVFGLGALIQEKILHLLQLNPTIWATYSAIAAEIEARSLLGLFYAAFFGALFFVALPVELIFIYYLGLNYYFVQILLITLVGNLLGIAVDYFIGWLIGPRVLQWFMKQETYKKFHQKMERAGAFIVIVGNIIPFPIEPFTLFLGAVRFGFVRLMIYTAIGKVVKFGLLWLGYKYFIQYVGPYVSTVNPTWFINLIKTSFGG